MMKMEQTKTSLAYDNEISSELKLICVPKKRGGHYEVV